jgi:hypothetical protein
MHFIYGFVMESLLLQWENIGMDICIIHDLTDICLDGFIIIQEKQAH